MSNGCLFCRIVAGDIPADKVIETDEVLAFMDIAPIIHGHVLVIPKTHQDPLMTTPVELLGKIMEVTQIVARAQTSALNADGINIVQNNGSAAGQAVFHIHFHVIPRFRNDGHHWNWHPRPYDDPGEISRLANLIRKEL